MPWFFRNRFLVLATLAFLFPLLALAVFFDPPKEDITFFLPDDPVLAEQFSAFPLTPPARLVFLELSARDAAAADRLDEAVRIVRQKLVPPLFTAVHPSPAMPRAEDLMSLVPSLLNNEEFTRYTNAAKPEELSASLPALKANLMGLQGVVLKEFIPADPLGMLAVLFDRMKRTGLLPKGREGKMSFAGLEGLAFGGGLRSADGRARLLFIETPLQSMDAYSATVVAGILSGLAPAMPEGVTASAISAHQQTAANIRTVQADMRRVLVASSAALALIFLIWLRSIASLPALFLPAFALLGAWGLLSLTQERLSGITLGFGAVLLGIVVDYALHIHCAIRAGMAPERAASALWRPLCVSFLTTAGAVSVLFFSDLPGMRQVGLFSILGCAVGLLLALLILPLLHRPPAAPLAAGAAPRAPGGGPRIRPLPFCLFLLCVAAAVWTGRNVTMQGDLSSLGVRDPALVHAEREFTERWGQGFRRSAMLVGKGPDTEGTLTDARNALQTVEAALRERKREDGGIISPLPLIPPPGNQTASRGLWHRFAHGSGPGLRRALGPGGEAAALGFADTAFAPFLNALDAPSQPITPGLFDQAGLGLIRALFLPSVVLDGKQVTAVISLVPDDPALLDAVRGDLPPGSIIFSPTGIAARISGAVRDDFTRMGLFALAVVTLCLAAALRSIRGFLLAMVPSLAGCATLLFAFGLSGRPMNMFTAAAIPLVMGLCAEYGIFMTRHVTRPDAASTPKAILLSGLTTLAGFGCLALADHPALHTLGLAVAAGIGAAIPAALWLLPLLAGKNRTGTEQL